ncbi:MULTISPECIES: helix-turn-helix domain-containing protein [Salinibaculum]|uniref:helix-turn-helix domain-containing protein n=1 Tax=Salinibaculum TaxID=2732368 RepID=UPI0030CB876E
MGKLDDVPTDRLREELAAAESAKAAKRVMVALAYKDGVSVTALADRYGIATSTLYHWLDRFEQRPVDDAASDDRRPGRPSKLADEERAAVEAATAEPPTAVGYNVGKWSPELLQQYIEEEFGTTYSADYLRTRFDGWLEDD